MKREKTSNSDTYGEIGVTISNNDSYDAREAASTICIPDGNGGKIDLKSNTKGADYKINKNGAGGS